VSAQDLVQSLADDINGHRSSDQVAVPAPCKSTVNDWKKISANLRAQVQQAQYTMCSQGDFMQPSFQNLSRR
jgi:hypothetical protein